MKHPSRTVAAIVAAVGLMLLAAGVWQFAGTPAARLWAQAPGGEHEGHDHDEHGGHEHDEDGHEEAAHEAHEGHEGHDHEGPSGAADLTPEQMRTFGIELATAGGGTVRRHIRLPGAIAINADTAAHIVPPAGGIVRKVMVRAGDRVEAGDVMAVLESADLSDAKTLYLAKLNELSCCSIDLARTEALHASTQKLLALLAGSPTLDDLLEADLPTVGEGQSRLISAYAERVFARSAYERERKLHGQRIASKADFQTAESAYKKAFAEYTAARGSLAFETQRALLAARRARQNTELEVRAAGRKLRVLGLSAADVARLKGAGGAAGAAGEACSDPNCPGCEAAGDGKPAGRPDGDAATEDHFGLYAVRAPFGGTVIQKHITPGERLTDDAEIFTIADMSSVWADLSVYQKDLPAARPGGAVRIAVGSGAGEVSGTIAYVSPIVDAETRTCTARVVLANPSGELRPGLFVTAELAAGSPRAAVLVPRGAVQRIEDEQVVFVATPEGLKPRPVTLGGQSRTHVEVASGLSAGERYVARGAFELKARIVTSGLGAHAGHGH